MHPEAAQSTAAYASQSGKGLLFFVKNESHKAQPIGIIKLVSFTLQTVDAIKRLIAISNQRPMLSTSPPLVLVDFHLR